MAMEVYLLGKNNTRILYPVSPDTEQHDAGPAGGKVERYG